MPEHRETGRSDDLAARRFAAVSPGDAPSKPFSHHRRNAGPMDIERETLVEVVVSTLAVGGFIVATAAIGLTYGDGGLSEAGAFALVGLIVAFIVLMGAAGYWLSGREA